MAMSTKTGRSQSRAHKETGWGGSNVRCFPLQGGFQEAPFFG